MKNTTHTPEHIRNNMKAIHQSGSRIEKLLQAHLWKRGLRYRKNYRSIIGKPDIAFPKYKLAVFCDSEFWHGYNWEQTKDRFHANKEFWITKIENNIARDRIVNKELSKEGWIVIRFWGKQIIHDPEWCVNLIEAEITRIRCKAQLLQ